MKIKILTRGGNKTYEVSGNPIILEIIASKKNVYHIYKDGSVHKIWNKRHLGVVEMLENRATK